jgi:hypothetical protein
MVEGEPWVMAEVSPLEAEVVAVARATEVAAGVAREVKLQAKAAAQLPLECRATRRVGTFHRSLGPGL